ESLDEPSAALVFVVDSGTNQSDVLLGVIPFAPLLRLEDTGEHWGQLLGTADLSEGGHRRTAYLSVFIHGRCHEGGQLVAGPPRRENFNQRHFDTRGSRPGFCGNGLRDRVAREP